MLNLYLVERKDSCGYDEYDAAVVVANSPKDAATIHPSWVWTNDERSQNEMPYYWKPDNLDVKYLGVAGKKQKRGLVLGSFNAG